MHPPRFRKTVAKWLDIMTVKIIFQIDKQKGKSPPRSAGGLPKTPDPTANKIAQEELKLKVLKLSKSIAEVRETHANLHNLLLPPSS